MLDLILELAPAVIAVCNAGQLTLIVTPMLTSVTQHPGCMLSPADSCILHETYALVQALVLT